MPVERQKAAVSAADAEQALQMLECYKQTRVADAALDRHSRRLLPHDGTTHPLGVAALFLLPGRFESAPNLPRNLRVSD
jgi:hypothetical protein